MFRMLLRGCLAAFLTAGPALAAAPSIPPASPTVQAETLGASLRRSVAAAPQFDPDQTIPWTMPPSYANSAALIAGEAVLGADGVSVYLVRTPGTTAATGSGPSGQAFAPITDGTVVFEYYGRNRATANDPAAPTVTISTTAPASPFTVNVSPLAANLQFSVTVAKGLALSTGYGSPWAFATGVPSTSNGLTNSNGATISFYSSAPQLYIAVANSPIRCAIDYRWYNVGQFHNVAYPKNYILLSWTGSGQAAKVHRYDCQFQAQSNMTFGGVYVTPLDVVYPAPQPSSSRVIAVIGSSIEQGGNGYPTLGNDQWPQIFGRLIGVPNVRNAGIGGTGVAYDQTGNSWFYNKHLSDLCGVDLVLYMGSINDQTPYSSSPTAYKAQVVSDLTYLLSSACNGSNTIVWVPGVYPGATGPSTTLQSMETDLLAAANSIGNPRIITTQFNTDPIGSWITNPSAGTCNTTTPCSNGNSALWVGSDNTHETQLGMYYMAQRYYRVFVSKVLPLIN